MSDCETDRKAGLGRRGFLTLAGVTGAALAMPHVARASVISGAEKRLSVHSLHTGESVDTIFRIQDELVPEGYEALNTLLRDHRTGDVYEMDEGLLDLLHALRRKVGGRKPFNLISGYRSPKTNAKLRSKSNGVAKRSYHMRGMAADVNLPGVDLRKLHRTARDMQVGGVGFYGKSGFIHVDTGPVRSW